MIENLEYIKSSYDLLSNRGVNFLPGIGSYYVNVRDKELTIKRKNMCYGQKIKYSMEYEGENLYWMRFDPQDMKGTKTSHKKDTPDENIIYSLAMYNWKMLSRPFFTEIDEIHCGRFIMCRDGTLLRARNREELGTWDAVFNRPEYYYNVLLGQWIYANVEIMPQELFGCDTVTDVSWADECIAYATTAMRHCGLLMLWKNWGKDMSINEDYLHRAMIFSKLNQKKKHQKRRYLDEF